MASAKRVVEIWMRCGMHNYGSIEALDAQTERWSAAPTAQW